MTQVIHRQNKAQYFCTGVVKYVKFLSLTKILSRNINSSIIIQVQATCKFSNALVGLFKIDYVFVSLVPGSTTVIFEFLRQRVNNNFC